MTVAELVSWLEKHGIPKEFCDAFAGRCAQCIYYRRI